MDPQATLLMTLQVTLLTGLQVDDSWVGCGPHWKWMQLHLKIRCFQNLIPQKQNS